MTSRIALLAACLGLAAIPGAAAGQTTPAPAHAPADSTAAPAAAPAPARARRRDTNLITAEEVATQSARDAYDVVSRLRPRWLRGYAAANNHSGGTDQVVIFLDGTRMGAVQELRRITATTVGEMRYIPSEEAVARWGMGYSAGVIMVTTR